MKVDPRAMVPDWLRDDLPVPPPKSAAAVERENANAWKMLDRFFEQGR